MGMDDTLYFIGLEEHEQNRIIAWFAEDQTGETDKEYVHKCRSYHIMHHTHRCLIIYVRNASKDTIIDWVNSFSWKDWKGDWIFVWRGEQMDPVASWQIKGIYPDRIMLEKSDRQKHYEDECAAFAAHPEGC